MTETVVGGASGTIGLTDEHRRAIAETLAGRKVDLERVYGQLERAFDNYQIFEQARINGNLPHQNKRTRQQQHRELIAQLIIMERDDLKELLAYLRDVQRHSIAGRHEEVIRDREREIERLEARQLQLDSSIKILDALCRAFSKNRHPFRKNLYIDVLKVWTDIIKGELTFRQPRGERGYPSGPLIDFVVAALKPVLGAKTPKPFGIAEIIKREHIRRGAGRRASQSARTAS
jgi:hypothetical protein